MEIPALPQLLVTISIAAAATFPAGSSARTDCSYANGPVYIETTSESSGTSDAADIAVGACVDTGSGALQGGLVEGGVGMDDGDVAGREDIAGARIPGVYVIADGDDANEIASQLNGYAGVSNFETGGEETGEGCENGGREAEPSTNSGGCTLWDPSVGPFLPIPLLVCGGGPNPYTGPSWENSTRDGCEPMEGWHLGRPG